MRKRARANPGRKHQTFDAIVEIYERVRLEFLKQVLPERYLVFPPRLDRCTLCLWDVGKNENAIRPNVLSCSNGTAETPIRSLRGISTTSPKTGCAPLWLGSGKRTERTTLTSWISSAEKFVTPK